MNNDKKEIRKFKRFLKYADQHLTDEFGVKETANIKENVLEEYRKLLPNIPNVGGKKNRLYSYLIQSAWALSLYRVLKNKNKPLDDINTIIQNTLRTSLYRIPKPIRHLIGKIRLSDRNIKKMKRAALQSQERKHSEDWVWQVIDGDGETFDLGIDYTECALVKFMHKQKADDLTSFLCETDYMVYEAFGIHLNRTKTLATGCDKCNFRLKLN